MIATRNRRSTRALLVAGLLSLGPAAVFAQEAANTPKTHTVKKGDTLWDLAATYLGDAFRWPELYRLNTDVVEDPHWIYPGEIIKLPGYSATMTPPGLAEPGRVAVEVAPPTTLPVDPLAPQPMSDPQLQRPTRFARRNETPPTPAAQPVAAPTVAAADTVAAAKPVEPPRPATTIRYGDFLRAPWLDRLKGPLVWGRIIGPAELPGIDPARQRGRFQMNDRVEIAPPTGSVAQERELYLTYHNGPLIEEVGQIIIPTGVIEVIRPPVGGNSSIAKIVRMFGEVNERDRLMPFDSSALSVVGEPVPVKNGAEGRITWIADDPVLPAVNYFIILSLSSRDGVKPGDEVELFEPRKKAKEEGGYATPEIPVGRAQVIRVTPQGVTAKITRLDQPKITKGTLVRVIAKMQ